MVVRKVSSTPENPAFVIVDSDGKSVPMKRTTVKGVIYYEMWLKRKSVSKKS